MDINEYLDNSIKNVAEKASKIARKSIRESFYLHKFKKSLLKSKKLRSEIKKQGNVIPPFLIASIASNCNLACKGCYSRSFGACADNAKNDELTPNEWDNIFVQASNLGISFILLAGGEPMLKKEIIEKAKKHKDIMFPIFTNGTLIDNKNANMFNKNRNLLPVLSIEGDSQDTDARRGQGVYQKISSAMELLKKKQILFGVSITLTTQNMQTVVDEKFINRLEEDGCGVIFYVEYVPTQKDDNHLVLNEVEREEHEKNSKYIKSKFDDVIIVNFPGDEKYMGGCLASGRGFFHINASGGAEPCPFFPLSDMNLKENSLLQVLNSKLFKILRESDDTKIPHLGGCALFGKTDYYKNIIEENKK